MEGAGGHLGGSSLRGNHFRQGEINGGRHRCSVRGTVQQRGNNNISTINSGDVQNDPVRLLIVDDAPRVARVGVAALQLPMRSVLADFFKAPDLRPLFVSPVLAVPWRQLIHVAKTA
jgi:hypothetical protein